MISDRFSGLDSLDQASVEYVISEVISDQLMRTSLPGQTSREVAVDDARVVDRFDVSGAGGCPSGMTCGRCSLHPTIAAVVPSPSRPPIRPTLAWQAGGVVIGDTITATIPRLRAEAESLMVEQWGVRKDRRLRQARPIHGGCGAKRSEWVRDFGPPSSCEQTVSARCLLELTWRPSSLSSCASPSLTGRRSAPVTCGGLNLAASSSLELR